MASWFVGYSGTGTKPGPGPRRGLILLGATNLRGTAIPRGIPGAATAAANLAINGPGPELPISLLTSLSVPSTILSLKSLGISLSSPIALELLLYLATILLINVPPTFKSLKLLSINTIAP